MGLRGGTRHVTSVWPASLQMCKRISMDLKEITVSDNKELHVIFGTGPVGTTLAEVLLTQDKRVRLVNRSDKGHIVAGAELIKGDAMQSEVVRDLTQGAAVVYHCANVPYPDQVVVMPQLQKSMLAGVAGTGARLVVMDTLYMYGKTHGQVMTEITPFAATMRKGQMRAQLAQTYLKAHHDGTVAVTLARAADF